MKPRQRAFEIIQKVIKLIKSELEKAPPTEKNLVRKHILSWFFIKGRDMDLDSE